MHAQHSRRLLGGPACLIAAGLAAGLAGPASAGATDAVCARDVLVAQSMQRQAMDQLENTGEDQTSLCRAWRRHVDTMRRLSGVYGRCLSGAERKARLEDVQGTETEFAGLVRTRCNGR